MKKLTIEKQFSKKILKSNEKAISAFKTYQETMKQLDAVRYALGKKGITKTQNNSTLNSNINFNGIGSTQNFQINTRLA